MYILQGEFLECLRKETKSFSFPSFGKVFWNFLGSLVTLIIPVSPHYSMPLFQLVDQDAHAGNPHRFKTINDVKSVYGDRVDNVLQVIDSILTTVRDIFPYF